MIVSVCVHWAISLEVAKQDTCKDRCAGFCLCVSMYLENHECEAAYRNLKMACFFGRSLLLVTLFVINTAAKPDINPRIYVTEANGTVYVTVEKPEHVHRYQLCMAYGVRCEGYPVPAENGTGIVRFIVTGLTPNRTYAIKIKPFGENKIELDTWLQYQKSVFIPLGTTPVPATVTTPTTASHDSVVENNDTTRVDNSDNARVLSVVVPFVLLFVFAGGGTALICLWRKGYWAKIGLLSCCRLRRLLGWDPPEILQLYVTETPQLNHFILTHGRFLEKVLDVRRVDCQQARDISDPEKWIKDFASKHDVLIYTSPILMSHIRIMQGEGSAEDLQDSLRQESQAKTHIQICLEVIESLFDSAEQRQRLLGRVGVVFVFSGCLDSDSENRSLLRRYFNAVPHFTVVTQDSPGTCLETPQSLVSHLSGGRGHVYRNLHDCDWAGTAEAEVLRGAATQLKRNHSLETDVDNAPPRPVDSEFGSSGSDVDDDIDQQSEPDQSTGNAHITLNLDVAGVEMDVTKMTVDRNEGNVSGDTNITVKLNLHSRQADRGQTVTYDRPVNDVTSGAPTTQHNKLDRHVETDVVTQTNIQADRDACTRKYKQADTNSKHFESQSSVALKTITLAPIAQRNGFQEETETDAHSQGQSLHYNTSTNAGARKISVPQDSGFSTDVHSKSSMSGSSSLAVHHFPDRHIHGRPHEQSRHQMEDGIRNSPLCNQDQRLFRGHTTAAHHEQKMAQRFTCMPPELSLRGHACKSVCHSSQASHNMHREQRSLEGYGNRQKESSPLHGHNNPHHEHEPTQSPNISCHQQTLARGSRTDQKQRPKQSSNNMCREQRPQHSPNNVHQTQRQEQSCINMYDEHRPQESSRHVVSVQATVHRSSSMLELRPGGLCARQPEWEDASQTDRLLQEDVAFHPPEPTGSQDSIDEQSRLLNEKTEQHWNSP